MSSGAAARIVLGGGLPLLSARLLFVAALLSVGGTLVFGAVVAPKALERMGSVEAARVRSALMIWRWSVLAAAIVGLGLWALLQTAEFADTGRIGEVLHELGPVLIGTVFGHVVLLQASLLAATGALLAAGRDASALPVVPALACVAAEAGHGHGMAMGGLFGPLSWLNALHLLAASVWIGGLPPFLLMVWLASPAPAAVAARWFSPIGKWAVCLLAASALLQGIWLVGSIDALIATPYGWTVLAKIALFGGLVGFAWLNRYVLAPGLRGARSDRARRLLVASVLVQSAFGLAAIMAAIVLSELVPGMDMTVESS